MKLISRPILIALLMALPCLVHAQQHGGESRVERPIAVMPLPPEAPIIDPGDNSFARRRLPVLPPYSGKYEARVGGASEPNHDRLRLDIGASTALFGTSGKYYNAEILAIGADFFTWTRLRDAGGFKFPVEAVDYYFGINGMASGFTDLGLDVRLRLAHISAHLVDGDPSFSTSTAQYQTFSREFVDLMIGGDAAAIGAAVTGSSLYETPLYLRPYIGGLQLFHTIPDTLGRFSPYVGFDLSWSLTSVVHARVGYELRVNTELETRMENSLRTGVKLGDQFGRGVLLEASYYRGRSPYGQHFDEMEERTSIGFAVEF